MANSANTIPQRFYALDTARGLCSLSVVFWHWKYMFFNGTTPGTITPGSQPLYPLFFAFYEKGYLAVDFFFCLSGFLFFWLYSARIICLEMEAREFFWLRFSRLYPLHICMLLVMLLGQQFMLNKTGSFFVYPSNDAYHFVLNVFLVMDWGIKPALSFNAPVWSVSIEILLYSLFFIICRKNVFRWCWIVAGLLVALDMMGNSSDIGRGAFSFLAGGLVYYLYARIAAAGRCENWAMILITATLTGFGLALLGLYLKLDVVGPTLADSFECVTALTGSNYTSVIGERIKWLLTTGLLFPLMLLTLVVVETARGALVRRWAYLGDLSYSIYLIHFPLQLFYAYAATSVGLDKSFFYTTQSLLLFLVLLMGLSVVSFHCLEYPARRFLRDIWPIFSSFGKSRYQVQREQAG